MTEDIKIKLTTELDSKGLTDLRKKLNDSRNEINAMARATEKGSAQWKQYKESTKELNRIIKLSDADLKKYTNSIIAEEQALKKSSKATDNLKKETKSLSDRLVITAGDIGGVVRGLVSFGINAIKVGSEFGVLQDSFKGTAQELALFRTATAGTISDGGLIKLSNYASDLGVNLEDQAKLFSLAEDAADKYGGTVEDNFERVINASDGSSRGLRSVGISVNDFNDELEKLVKTTGKHLDSMSAEEQQNLRLQAIFNLTGTTLEKVSQKTQDAKDKFDSLKVAGENFLATFGDAFVKGLSDTAKGLETVANTSGIANKKINILETSAQALGIVLSKFNTIGFFTFLINQLDDVKQIIGEIGGFGFLREKAQFSGQIAEGVTGDPLGALGSLGKTENTDASLRQKKISQGSQQNQTTEKTVELTNELIEAQKKYNDLLLIESTFTDDERKQLVYIKYLNQVRDVLSQIQGLQLPATLLNVNGTAADVTGFENIGQIKSQEAPKVKEERRNIYEDVTNTYGAINSMMSVLNLGTETFVSKMLGGFNSVLIIMESIKAVNSILSFIPGFASGGSFSGGPMIVGERGPELLFANTSGYVMNNQDSQRYLNQNVNNSQPAINVYVGANLSPKYFTAQLEKANSRKNYIKV